MNFIPNSNLACLNSGSSNSVEKKNQQQSQNSEESSSTEDDTRAVILTNDRGTSSLQLSDSEDDNKRPSSSLVHTHSTRRIKTNAQQQVEQQQQQAQTSKKIGNVDTDSVNENFSPVRPSTKRKRKFKRMALDPADNNCCSMETVNMISKGKTGTIKRKKVRSKSACDSTACGIAVSQVKSRSSATGSGAAGGNPNTVQVQRQRQISTANVVPGKRKRSSREKSVEPDLIVHSQSASVPSHSMITEEVCTLYFDVRRS